MVIRQPTPDFEAHIVSTNKSLGGKSQEYLLALQSLLEFRFFRC